MKKTNHYELWRRKLSYLVANHGGLVPIARATGLKPKAVDQIAKGIPKTGRKLPPRLDPSAARQIEQSLDLPDGWFDTSAFLPSRL